MNERIKELAERAWIADCIEQFPEYKKNEMTKYLLQDMEGFHKKFAELLIKECCAQIENERPIFIPTEWDQGSSWGHKNSIDVIKQHFGV